MAGDLLDAPLRDFLDTLSGKDRRPGEAPPPRSSSRWRPGS